LPLESQLNIDCDLAAKHHLQHATKPATKPTAMLLKRPFLSR
jgi:hypothetical protein